MSIEQKTKKAHAQNYCQGERVLGFFKILSLKGGLQAQYK